MVKYTVSILVTLFGIACAPVFGSQNAEQLLREGINASLLARVSPAIHANPPRKNMTEEELTAETERVALALTECTVLAMKLYPPIILEAGYQVLYQGGGYPGAKEAMDIAIHDELSAGGERQTVMSEAVTAVGTKLKDCSKRISE
jgi:hypothetical protein